MEGEIPGKKPRNASPEVHKNLAQKKVRVVPRKPVEEQLRASEERLRDVERIAKLGSWDWNIENNTLHWSDEIYAIFGRSPRQFEATYEAFLESVHPGDREFVERSVEEALHARKPYNIEHRILLPDGTERFVQEMAEVTYGAEGRPVRMVGTVMDITERKRKEEELREAYEEIAGLKKRLEKENVLLREELQAGEQRTQFLGNSDAVRAVLQEAERVADTDSLVLIYGETGTGKELLAQEIHRRSSRGKRIMVKVNCAALPAGLIESELFGREKGAFTGSVARQVGRFEHADRSTIFLDEIGELPFELQSKLLRVIESGEFERLGSPRTVRVDSRIIAATNRDLEECVEKGLFRKDLYYRLCVFPISIPPLRERREDILPLAWSFVREFEMKMARQITGISERSTKDIEAYDWPGNARELRNAVERSMILNSGPTLHIQAPRPSSSRRSNSRTLEEQDRRHIEAVLESAGWKVSGEDGAAAILGLKRTTLEAKMKKLGIKRP